MQVLKADDHSDVAAGALLVFMQVTAPLFFFTSVAYGAWTWVWRKFVDRVLMKKPSAGSRGEVCVSCFACVACFAFVAGLCVTL